MSSNFSLDSSNGASSAEPVQILYDGDRPDCVQEIAFWQERYRTRSPLRPFQAEFIDLSQAGSDPTMSLYCSRPEYQGKILIRLSNGQVLERRSAFEYLEQQLGLGLLSQVARWPGLGFFFRGWYQSWVTEKLPHTGRWSEPLQTTLITESPAPDGEAIVGEETFWEWENPEPQQPGESHPPESDELDALLADLPSGSDNSHLEVVDGLTLDHLDLETLDLDHLDALDGLESSAESSFCIIENIQPYGDRSADDFQAVESSESSDSDPLNLDLEELTHQSIFMTGEVFSTSDVLDAPHEFEQNQLTLNEGDLDLTGLLPLEDLEHILEVQPTALETSSLSIEHNDRFGENSLEPSADSSELFDSMDTFIESAGNLDSIGSLGMPMGNVTERSRHLPPGRMDQTMRVPVRQLDGLSNLIAEMVVSRNCMESEHERLRQFLTNLLYQMQQLSDLGQRFQDLYERSLLENALISSRQSFSHPFYGTSKPEQQKFDALEMDHFGEFHLLSQEMIELIVRARESASDIDYVINEPLDYIARHFRQVTTQVQESLNRSRMVPFEQGTLRLPRAIREVALRSGKEATLVVDGKDTLVDKVLLEQLYDPLTHLISNAIIHGIEPPEERTTLGKDPCGTITIQAFYQGNQTVIVVKDDGAGIDAERVRMKALQKGLINLMQAQTLKDIDMFDLIFNPGFSTRDQADTFAGRGIGMDVVKTRIESLRGSISVDSSKSKGTRFTIRLPLTLSITKALCCISNRARIAFPMDSIEDMLDLHQDEIKQDRKQRLFIRWREQNILFKPLSELLKYNRSLSRSTVYAGGAAEDDMLSIIILRTTGDYLAVQVDWVEGEKEIVIKQLERPIPKPSGIAGVTVLSDGQILPIVDVLELAEMSRGRLRQPLESIWKTSVPVVKEPVTDQQPVVLIVDDSITVRELLSMTFKKGNYRVEQARDGREAWDKLRSGLPCDLIFCDIEMPRMTGLELLEKLQRDRDLKHIPIAMLTSRGADRHRQMAMQLGAKAYFTKPYLEEMLLEAAQRMLKGGLTDT